MSKIKELQEKLNDCLQEMTEMLDKAETETRALTTEENARYGELETEIDALTKTIDRLEHRTKQEATSEPKEEGEAETEEQKEVRTFEQYCRGEQRALKVGTNGDIMPRTVVNNIITQIKETCPIMDLATVYHTNGELVIPYYDESTNTIEVTYIDELQDTGDEKTGELKSIKLQGNITRAEAVISKKLINNTDIDIVGFVETEITNKMRKFIEKEALTGKTGKVKGIFENATNKKTAATGVLTADDLIATQLLVKTAYQENAVWIMDTSTFEQVRKLKDAEGRYLLIPDVINGSGFLLLGKKVYLSESVPKFADNAKVLAYGDFKGYTIKIGKDIEMQVLQEKFAKSYAVGILSFMELDGAITNQQMIAVLEMGTGAAATLRKNKE